MSRAVGVPLLSAFWKLSCVPSHRRNEMGGGGSGVREGGGWWSTSRILPLPICTKSSSLSGFFCLSQSYVRHPGTPNFVLLNIALVSALSSQRKERWLRFLHHSKRRNKDPVYAEGLQRGSWWHARLCLLAIFECRRKIAHPWGFWQAAAFFYFSFPLLHVAYQITRWLFNRAESKNNYYSAFSSSSICTSCIDIHTFIWRRIYNQEGECSFLRLLFILWVVS